MKSTATTQLTGITLFKGSANQLTITRTTFELSEVLAQLGALNDALVGKKGLTLDTEVASDLAPLHADPLAFLSTQLPKLQVAIGAQSVSVKQKFLQAPLAQA